MNNSTKKAVVIGSILNPFHSSVSAELSRAMLGVASGESCKHSFRNWVVVGEEEQYRCAMCGAVLAETNENKQPNMDVSHLFERTQPATAQEFLNAAEIHMGARANTYDKPEGERSMAKTVEAFNTITGRDLSETDGWLMMTLLKAVRANQGQFKSDNYEDLVAYAALMGESASNESRKPA